MNIGAQRRAASRLGRVEIAILNELSRSGGLTQRDEVLAAAFPRAVGDEARGDGTPTAALVDATRVRRARAEAAVSRAIVSLERKGLVVRERNPITGRTALRDGAEAALPVWEQLARAEEDMAAHCRRVAAEWAGLAGRARGRAAATRRERSSASTEALRQEDIEAMHRLEGRPR